MLNNFTSTASFKYQQLSSLIAPPEVFPSSQNRAANSAFQFRRLAASAESQSSSAARIRSGLSSRSQKKKTLLVPKKLTFYNLRVSGSTYYGNTYVPQSNTSYTLAENFSLRGLLSIERGIRPAESYSNGKNARDIGLYVGNIPSLGVGNGTAGSAWFGTNNQVFRNIGSGDTDDTSTDIAFVGVKTKKGIVQVRIDGNSTNGQPAQLVQENRFNWRSSFSAASKQILVGGLALEFSDNGRTVKGRITVYGASSLEPGAYAYDAVFEGERQKKDD